MLFSSQQLLTSIHINVQFIRFIVVLVVREFKWSLPLQLPPFVRFEGCIDYCCWCSSALIFVTIDSTVRDWCRKSRDVQDKEKQEIHLIATDLVVQKIDEIYVKSVVLQV